MTRNIHCYTTHMFSPIRTRVLVPAGTCEVLWQLWSQIHQKYTEGLSVLPFLCYYHSICNRFYSNERSCLFLFVDVLEFILLWMLYCCCSCYLCKSNKLFLFSSISWCLAVYATLNVFTAFVHVIYAFGPKLFCVGLDHFTDHFNWLFHKRLIQKLEWLMVSEKCVFRVNTLSRSHFSC